MKKLNKFFAVLVALAMMATLCVSMAFAGGTTEDNIPYGEANDAKLAKILKIAQGVQKPDATFTFNFTQIDTDTIKAETTPVAANTAQISTSTMTTTANKTDGASVTDSLLIANLFKYTDGENAGKYKFTKAGVYAYEVTEATTGYTNTDTDTEKTTMSYDINHVGKYIVRLYVTKDADGNTNIDKITVQKDGENGAKVDPTVDPKTDNVDPDAPTGATIVNNFDKEIKNSEFKPDEDKFGVLSVGKTVTGDLADYSAAFPFDVTITKPAESAATEVEYYIYDGTALGQKKTKAFTENVATVTESLKNGQYIVFKQLPAGATYSAKERLLDTQTDNVNLYTASVTGPAEAILAQGETAVAEGANLETETVILNDTDSNLNIQVTNAFDKDGSSTTPTGILISNLPYIALALVAIGGLVAYVVVRRRQSDEA